ncbi:MAG TPA: dihydrofolate reductase family protein [Gemmatimonadales bacterium]|nr:dihydrofolate reductase family protein [Gemmatimonadales bacterium]
MKGSVFIATSLDGFIARPDGGIEWLPHGTTEDHGYNDFIATVDAIVMGRHSYEKVLTFDKWYYGATRVVVLSSRPIPPAPPGADVHHLSGTPDAVAAELDRRGIHRAYIDGGVTIQRFLRAGLIDRIIITRIPVLLGQGIPLFGELAGDILLDHVATRSWPSGLVQSEYRVKEPRAESREPRAESREPGA